MNAKTTLSITDARKNIYFIADAVQQPGTHYTLTENGRSKAVIMSAEEFDSWQETLEVMQEFPNLLKDAKEIDKAIESGEYKQWVTLEDLLREQGFVSAQKPEKPHDASHHTSQGRKKTQKASSKRLR